MYVNILDRLNVYPICNYNQAIREFMSKDLFQILFGSLPIAYDCDCCLYPVPLFQLVVRRSEHVESFSYEIIKRIPVAKHSYTMVASKSMNISACFVYLE